MKIKWDNVSKTFSIASELSVLNKRHFKKKHKGTESSVTDASATILGFLYFFSGKKTEASCSFCREGVGISRPLARGRGRVVPLFSVLV